MFDEVLGEVFDEVLDVAVLLPRAHQQVTCDAPGSSSRPRWS